MIRADIMAGKLDHETVEFKAGYCAAILALSEENAALREAIERAAHRLEYCPDKQVETVAMLRQALKGPSNDQA